MLIDTDFRRLGIQIEGFPRRFERILRVRVRRLIKGDPSLKLLLANITLRCGQPIFWTIAMRVVIQEAYPRAYRI